MWQCDGTRATAAQSMLDRDLILVVPCYNEAARLAPQAFLDFVAARPSIGLLFVDDGSTDETPRILDALKVAAPEAVHVVRVASNQGKAEAVRAGLLEALRRGPRLVGFWDADLSTPLEAVDDFLALIEKRPGVEVVLGSRVMLMGKDIRRKVWRHYLGRVCATLVSLALDLPVYDTQCGAKIFRANEAVAAVFAAPFRSRWIFDVELLARYLSQPTPGGEPPRSARIYELALSSWHHKPGSKLRWTAYLRALADLVRIWRARRAGRR
jgi:glycosyltransferase involved in cell wall biosynthesis